MQDATGGAADDQDFGEWFAVALVALGEVIWTARKTSFTMPTFEKCSAEPVAGDA